MSEVLKAPCVAQDEAVNARKTVRKVIIDDSDDDLVEEVLEDISEEEYEEERMRCQRREARYDELRPRRRMTAVSVHSVVGGEARKNFHITCLVCQRKITCSDAKSSLSAYYICDKCMDGEKEQTRELEAVLLNSNDRLRSLPLDDSIDTARDCAYCKCQNCTRRRQTLEEEQEREIEMLQSCWHDLRQNIRQMFRDGLDSNLTSLKGKKFDVDKIKRNVAILAEKDPHQLYKRLESIGHEYVMNLKSDDLWQILVVPQVVPALIELFESGASEEKMELERAKLFIKSLLDRFSCQQETVRNMSPLLAALDEEYLTQFGISWKIVNHHIFDCVIYQDDLLFNYLPSMEKVLKCHLIIPDESDEERAARERREAARTDIPPGALELAQSFRVFHKLMVTSREIFKKANANIALFAEQQNIIHQITRKAKGELLEEDLEFFKSQRRMMRNCASKRQHYRWRNDLPASSNIDHFFNEEDDNTDSEADAIDFSKRLHELIDEGPAACVCIDQNGKVAPSMECKECSVRHCSCDECRISHVITCGLLGQDDDFSTNLVWSKSSTDVSDKGEDKDSENETSERRKSPSGPSQRPVHRSLRFQAARALFTLHDHYNKKEIAWGDWQVPYNFASDLDYDEHCLNDKSDLLNETKGPSTTDLFDENNKFDKDDFMENEAFVAAIKDVAEQIGYDIQETVIGKARTQSWDFYDLTKFGFDLNQELKAQIKTHLSALFKSKISLSEDIQNSTEKNVKEGECEPSDGNERDRCSSSSAASSTSKTVQAAQIGVISHLSATKKTCKLKKGLRANKATANVSSSDDQSETDSESSSPSLAGTADWSQIKLVNDTVLDSKTLEEYCNKASLSDSDRLMLKEVTQRQLAVLSRNENTVSGLALELFGKKVMEKPQLAPKTQPTPSVTRIIRKLKANADKCDGLGNSVIAATPKPLAASAKERLLLQMKDAERKARERAIAHLPKTYEGEKWTANDDFKVRVADKLNDCLSNEWSKVEDVAGLKTSVVTATQENKICNRVGSANERCSKSSVAKKTSQPVRASSEAGGTPRTGCVGGTRKEGDAVAQMDKIEKEKMTRMRTKQAVARQHNHSKTSADAAKTQLPSDRKVKSSGCCSRTHKSSTHGQKADANSLSTTVDFNVDLNDFDFRSFSSEMAKKLREGGKLDKLIAQAVGMGATKMALSGKLEYKCEDVKRLGYCDSKEEILGCHSDNDIDDLSEDDEEDSGDNWSECESVDHAHPHRHHSCDNKKKVERTASGSRRDTRGHVHCDCCYCEMFGHSAAESTKAGRVPQIRERLRLKLKRRNGQEGKSESQSKNRSNCQDKQDLTKMVDKEKTNTDATETTEEAKPVTVGDAPIEEILDYINEKDNAVAQAAASKAAKRARQKQRKQEEKERLEKERKKQEELRKAQEAEALRMKKEKQAAQQAASREKALKAEEKKRKAAEDRARAQKRQKELRELERQQQQAKEQERARKMQAARQAAAKKAAEEKEAARKERAAIPSAEKFSERAESNEPVKEVAQKPHSQVPQKSHSISCSPLPTNNEPRPPSAPSSIPVAQSSTAPDDFVAMSERKQQSILQPSASTLTTFSEGADAPTTKPSLSQVNSLPRQRGVISPDRHPTVRPMHLDEQGLYAAFAMQQSNLTTQLPSTIEQQQQACVDFDYPGFGAVRCSAFATGMPSTAGFYENSLAAALNPLRPPSVPFDPRPVNAATSYVVPPLGTTPYYNGGSISPLSTMAASRMAQCAQAIPAQTLFGTGVDVNTQRPQQHASLSNVTSNGLYCMLGNKCVETPCSSNSSTSSSLCSTSTQQFERLPYTGGLIGGAPLGCGGGGGKCVEKNATAALRLGAGYLSDTSSSCASLPHAVNALSLSTSSLFQNSDPFPLVAPLNNCQPANVNAALQRSAQALNNGLGQLDAVKCGEATRSATFTSVSSLAAPSPLATYESETKMLAAVAEQDSVFAPTQNPMIFEPGDPRIAAAIASMKFDPHETFKPRPDTELEFLDPFEQEIEHFKRVMWEEKNASRARVPLRELPRIEPENEENAVFHFDPLV